MGLGINDKTLDDLMTHIQSTLNKPNASQSQAADLAQVQKYILDNQDLFDKGGNTNIGVLTSEITNLNQDMVGDGNDPNRGPQFFNADGQQFMEDLNAALAGGTLSTNTAEMQHTLSSGSAWNPPPTPAPAAAPAPAPAPPPQIPKKLQGAWNTVQDNLKKITWTAGYDPKADLDALKNDLATGNKNDALAKIKAIQDGIATSGHGTHNSWGNMLWTALDGLKHAL